LCVTVVDDETQVLGDFNSIIMHFEVALLLSFLELLVEKVEEHWFVKNIVERSENLYQRKIGMAARIAESDSVANLSIFVLLGIYFHQLGQLL
jgi:hypothetical protein